MVFDRVVALGAALVLAGSLSGCSGTADRNVAPSARPTTIQQLDPATVRLARVRFCDLVPVSDVRRALGGDPQGDAGWTSGDPVPGATGSGDVGQEIGCAWTRPDGTAARAWVFARPVTTELAGTLVAQAGRRQGCRAEPTAVFGTPALLQTCGLPGGVQRVRRAGLFGDTWFTCELTAAAAPTLQPTLKERTDTWCAAVVSALQVPGRS